MLIEPAFGTVGSVGRCQVLLENEISISIKLVSRRKHEVLFNLLLTVGFRKHSGPTPADDTAAHIITDCGNFTLDLKQHGFCVSPLVLQTLIYKWNTTFTFIWKRTLEHWATGSPGKMLLTMFLVQKRLGSSSPEDVWVWWLLMHWLQLQVTPCEALPSVLICFAWLYSQACAHPCCLCTFSFYRSTLHLICFDTALLEQPLPPFK